MASPDSVKDGFVVQAVAILAYGDEKKIEGA